MIKPIRSRVSSPFRSWYQTLAHSVRKFRSYLVPSHIRTYRSIVRQHPFAPVAPGKKVVCLDLSQVQIDRVGGRYLYSLIRDFEALGLLIYYRKNFRFLATMRHKQAKRLLLERSFRIYNSVGDFPENLIAAEITDRTDAPMVPGHRQVRIKYERRWPDSGREVPLTFFVYFLMHDRLLATPAPALDAPRPWRIFFAGRAVGRIYGTDILPREFGKMSRGQILKALETSLPEDRLWRIESDSALADQSPRCGFVRSVSERFEIPPAQWFGILARADFFLACPGTEMPLCHNLVEALSRGTVPILEHPEFLDPPLRHNVNCLAFSGPEQLIKVAENAFQLRHDGISRLRTGAYEYYQKHLAPGKFAERLLAHPSQCVDLLWDAYRARRPLPERAASPPEIPFGFPGVRR